MPHLKDKKLARTAMHPTGYKGNEMSFDSSKKPTKTFQGVKPTPETIKRTAASPEVRERVKNMSLASSKPPVKDSPAPKTSPQPKTFEVQKTVKEGRKGFTAVIKGEPTEFVATKAAARESGKLMGATELSLGKRLAKKAARRIPYVGTAMAVGAAATKIYKGLKDSEPKPPTKRK